MTTVVEIWDGRIDEILVTVEVGTCHKPEAFFQSLVNFANLYNTIRRAVGVGEFAVQFIHEYSMGWASILHSDRLEDKEHEYELVVEPGLIEVWYNKDGNHHSVVKVKAKNLKGLFDEVVAE